ncbi:MAG: chalcone isomerase family protein [Cytophagaceae bacterium]
MIKLAGILLLCTGMLTAVPAISSTGDNSIPEVIKVKESNLILNGLGTRRKFWIDLYNAGLYLQQKCSDAATIINADEPMAIKIEVISDVITSKRLEEGMRSEFDRVTNGNTAPYRDRIEELVKIFKEDVKVGDTYDLIYLPEEGLNIYKNNELKATIPGLDFKKVAFTSWVGHDPGDAKLSKALLGVGKTKKKKRGLF